MIYVMKVTAYESMEAYESNGTPEAHIEIGYENPDSLCTAMWEFSVQARREGVLPLLKRLFRKAERAQKR